MGLIAKAKTFAKDQTTRAKALLYERKKHELKRKLAQYHPKVLLDTYKKRRTKKSLFDLPSGK
jgi:hypothetical protein